MAKLCVLAEKPSVARDIARVLKCTKKGNGFIEGNDYVVTWALGHLVTLASPEEYNKDYKTWDISQLPMIPKKIQLSVISGSAKQYKAVKDVLFRKDVTGIIIATDAGREGELVARLILEKSGCKKPIKRLWISSVTDKAIKDGFSKLKDGREYNNLYMSAMARAESDWIVGINASRALTCQYNTSLSAGRVQTPTVAIIQKREDEIRNFKSKKYYGLSVGYKGDKFSWLSDNSRIFDEKIIDSTIAKINGKPLKITNVSSKEKKSYSKELYDLTELQRDCNKLFGFTPKETLNVMQKLYEAHKVLTYPRTDSRYISDDVVPTLKDRVNAVRVGKYSKAAATILRNPIKGSKNFVNNAKVSDHHAIIPTEESANFSAFNDRERKVYDLVVKRFLSVLMEPCRYEELTVEAEIEGQKFKTTGKRIISKGYREVVENDDEADEEIKLQYKVGEILSPVNVIKTSGETKPKPRFNEATLLSAMENPAEYMDDKDAELKRTIGDTGGLGTVATRADIIEKLFNAFMLEKKGKDIYVTSKGKQLLNLVPEGLKTPDLTAKWELSLSNIAKGKQRKEDFIKDMEEYSRTIVNEIKNSKAKFHHDNLSGQKCPDCGKIMLSVSGKHGKMLVCQDRNCGYRKKISQLTNARCPNCHKKLELKGEGDKKIFTCQCGHREKLSAFNARKEKEGSKLNKKEVSAYLRNQQKQADEPVNSALADALAKLNLK